MKINNTKAVIETAQNIVNKIVFFAKECKSTYTTKVVPIVKKITSITHKILVWVMNFLLSRIIPKDAEAGFKKVVTRVGIPVAIIAGIILVITAKAPTAVFWGIILMMTPRFIVNNLKLK